MSTGSQNAKVKQYFEDMDAFYSFEEKEVQSHKMGIVICNAKKRAHISFLI